jgi:hypothetical protein
MISTCYGSAAAAAAVAKQQQQGQGKPPLGNDGNSMMHAA